MRKAIHVAGAEHEAAAELERVCAKLVLAMPSGACAFPGARIVQPEEMKQIGGVQPGDAIGLASFINQQRKTDSGVLSKPLGVVPIAQTNCRQFGALRSEVVIPFAHLRDVLATKNSPVVTQKNNDGGTALPKRAEAHLATIGIWKNDRREALTEGRRHAMNPSLPGGRCQARPMSASVLLGVHSASPT